VTAADWNTIFEWIISFWEEVNHSTILNEFRVSFGEHRDFPQIEENEMEVNETDPNIADVPELFELLESFSIIVDERCDGFIESDVGKF